MNLIQLSIMALLLLAGSSFDFAYARAIDEVDNSIEGGESPLNAPQASSATRGSAMPRSRIGTDWLKFTKAPPAKLLQDASPLEIVCEVMGSQIPTIQWVVGHLPLNEVSWKILR